MYKNIHTIILLLFCFSTVFSQQKTQINPVPRSTSDANFRVGCSLFNDPNNYSTGSSFSYNAPVNNNSNLTTASGTSLGCMYSVPNQAWFVITVNTGGNLYFNFSNSNGYDVDAVIWGPIAGNDVSNACSSTQNYPTTCDWDAGRPDLYLNGAQAGQKYVMLVTNYSNANTVINISQPSGGSVTYSMVNLPNCSLVPTASISGTSATINEGQSVNLSLSFTGSSPWNYTLSDGTTGTAFTSPINVSVYPTASQTYTINSVSNLCGTSGGSGGVGISVVRNVQLKTCLPLDGNAVDSQGLNSGSLQNGVSGTLNRTLETNKALQFDGIDDYVSVPTNQLNNSTYAFASWVKLDELPTVSNSESIIMSMGGILDEHYLGIEYTNGNPSWKFSSNGNSLYSSAIVDLNWHLIVGVRSGGQLKIFVDGVLTGSATVSGTANYGSPLSFRIGSGITNTKFFKGKIDDVKIFNGSLIEPEILLLQNYNSCNNVYNDTFISVQSVSTSVICTGSSFVLRAFTNNILPDGQLQFTAELSNATGDFSNPTIIGASPFLPLTVTIPNNIAGGNYKVRVRYGGLISVNTFPIFVNNPATYNINGTVALNDGQSSNLTLNFTGTGPWNYIMSDGLSGVATTSPWLITVTPDQSTIYSISSAQNVCGNASVNGSSFATVSINYTKQFVTCLPFNGNALDTKTNNTTTVNGPILTENRYGQTNAAYTFNGTSNYIEYTTNLLRKREFTMSAWVLANSISGSTQYILSQGEFGTNTFQGLGVNSSGWFFQSSTTNGLYSISNSNNLATNQWVHLTAVRTYQSLKLYVNGNLVSSISNSSIIPFKTSDIGRIGANSSALGNYFNGKIDDVKLFKGSLSDDEVFALYINTSDCPTVENSSIIVARSISPSTVCAGNNISLGYTASNVNVSPSSPLTVQLSDASGFFGSPTTLGSGTSSPISVTIPSNAVNSIYYRIRLVSAGNVVSVNSIGLVVSGSLPTATISGGGSIPFGGTSSVSISFTGTAPWTFALNNGASQTVNTSPANISVSPYGTTTYTVTSVSNSCGAGTGIGSAVVNVAPNIILGTIGSVFCQGQSFNVPFTANYSASPNFRAELSDASGSFSSPVNIGTGINGNISVIIPNNVAAGTAYRIRIVSDSPVYTSPEFSNLTINAKAVATISGTTTINEGESANVTINFNGTAPYTYSVTNGSSQTTSLNSVLISVNPLLNTTYQITAISNACGLGISSGTATITVNPIPIRLVSCFPFNGNANDGKGLNNGIVNGATLTTDRFGNINTAYSFDSPNNRIEINPISNLIFEKHTVSLWFFSQWTAGEDYLFSIKNSNSEILSGLFQNGDKLHYVPYGENPMTVVSGLQNGNWNNVVIVRDLYEFKIYLNGNLQYSSSAFYSTNISLISKIVIGNGIDSQFNYYSGKIDDFQIYKGSLTAGQVQALYQNTNPCFDASLISVLSLNSLSSTSFCTNQSISIPFSSANTTNPIKVQLSDASGSFASPTEIGLGSTSPILAQIPVNQTTGTGYKIRLVSSNAVPIVSNLSATISINTPATATISGTASINEGQSTNLNINFSGTSPYTYTITGGTSQTTNLSSVSIPVYPLVNTTYEITTLSNTCGTAVGTGSAIITVNPVAIRLVSCFPFNGNANDSKGLNNALIQGVSLSSDRFENSNSAYYFNGNGFLECQPALGILNLEFSLAMYFNSTSAQVINSSLTLINLSTNTLVLKRKGNGTYIIQFTGMSNFGSDFYEFPLINYSSGIWHSLVLIHSFDRIKLYIDNVLIGNVIPNIGYEEATYGFPRRIIIGSLENNYQNFNGKIDDVQIYKGALTAGQVQALYQNTNPCFGATTYTCLSDNVFDNLLSGQQTLQVSNQIIGRNSIQAGANIHFDSKNSVILEPGFKTEPNSIFKATVGGGCN